MIGTELQNVFLSYEFKLGLEELSSYLASIKQERSIIYLLARCLWRRGYKFELEDRRHDLSLDGKRIEFKFSHDRCEKLLTKEMAELEENGNDLQRMWAERGKASKSWGVMLNLYEDACVREPQVFVWIICSRDLSKVAPDDLKRICLGREQRTYNATHPCASNGELLTVADSFLGKLQAIRRFSVLKQAIETNGDFPSTYHFRICDFV